MKMFNIRIFAVAMLIVGNYLIGTNSCAAITETPPGVDLPQIFSRQWDWTFAIPAEGWPPPAPIPPAANWDISLSTTALGAAGPLGTKDLTLNWTHVNGPHPIDIDPNGPFKLTIDNVNAPNLAGLTRQYTRAQLEVHNTIAEPHFDFVQLSAVVRPAGTPQPVASIYAKGEHLDGKKEAKTSIHNGLPKPANVIKFKASYPDGSTRDLITTPQFLPTGGVIPNIPIPKNNDLDFNNLELKLQGSGISETSLGFIGGNIGSFSLMDMSMATEFIVGVNNEYLVPSLFSEQTDLFVGIDLLQWLTFPTQLNPLDTIIFTNGVSAQCPGCIAGTTPITFSPTDGWVTANLYTGPAYVGTFTDGKVVPEPSLLSLTLIALIALYPRVFRNYVKRVDS